jgi:hypothetical protein
MHRTWKYRLYPTAAQAHQLERQLALACDLYNAALEQRVWAWRRHRVSISFRERVGDRCTHPAHPAPADELSTPAAIRGHGEPAA